MPNYPTTDSSDTNTHLVLLVAINARYSHSSLAMRSLIANMPDIPTALLECEIKQSPEIIAEKIISTNPTILALGVYIWNRTLLEKLIPLLRTQLPQCKIILGGPEISYDTSSPLAQLADCVICGEAEEFLPQICQNIITKRPVAHIQHAPPPDLSTIRLPTEAYTDADLQHRNIYIETSRGCPCACRFCLSSLTCGVRYYPLDAIFAHLDQLCGRGARQFRFVDRSFNLAGERAVKILEYFLHKNVPDLFLHLEIVPEFLSAALRETILRFPPGALHIETGIQSLNEKVLKRINRPARPEAALEGIHWLTNTAGATVHADLIAGLPGETLDSFIQGFEALYRTGPAEIQLGILKHLPGTDLHQEPSMHFSRQPPYEVLASDAMTASELDQIRRFAAHWERIVNRNHFPNTMKLLLQGSHIWNTFDACSLVVAQKHGIHGMGLVEIARELHTFLQTRDMAPAETIRNALAQDYLAEGRRINLPTFLRPDGQ